MKRTDQYHGLVPGFQGNSVRLLSRTLAAQIKNSVFRAAAPEISAGVTEERCRKGEVPSAVALPHCCCSSTGCHREPVRGHTLAQVHHHPGKAGQASQWLQDSVDSVSSCSS